ncbi:MAG: binding-protein-dependent transport system inner rane component [Actinobacteria bacterium]|nr:binding-protein-dependent transport system inner rane component [Actinomycetota bacterium]
MAAGTDVLNPPAPARRRGKATRRARDERRLAYMLCAPAVVVMLAVTAYPILYAVWLSLRRADLRFPAQSAFVGLANYVTVLRSGLWWQAVANTVIITVVSVAIELVFGMAIALVMHRALIGRTAVRTAVLIPYGIITVVAAFSWRFAWTPSLGYLPRWLHLNGDPLTAHASSLAIIILAEVWKTTPFMSLLLAGLALVSNELLEAARVDGATAWQRFTNVILPVMKPAILVAVLFRVMDAFRIFDNIFILTQGSNSTQSVSILGYDQLFVGLNLGIGSAMSVLIFVMIAIIGFGFIKGFGAAAPGMDTER